MFRRVVSAMAMALLLVSCAKNAEPPQPVDTTPDASTVTLHFSAASGLNPGSNGQPAPVRVRIFELKNAASFGRADYFALAERAPSALAADLIDQDEVLLQPGQDLTLERHLNEATRQVGLAVGYREIDQAQWRALLSVTPRQASEYQIHLDTHAVSVSRASAAQSVRPAQ
ncbi:type VI secretion system lipoprotein TssJ [Pseudomonas sp. SLFW]|uniref:type VI secretion system lipoprotein TssJ n=1 Tax=Pseudomonas sp. SLFW TaxID=2683259 RepID=UPI001412AB2B|nr:type VI secretion system lipoprotein TssJ [Pseudomonas sp. SLFW]NBB10711.1 type VI secretion system lipoprotein TssJ [Pseudomonas sp. SLFW]